MQKLDNRFDIYFSELSDPRIARAKLYPFIEILFVVLCGSICGAKSWRDFVLFGKENIELLREYYPFVNGIASKDTFASRLYLKLMHDKKNKILNLTMLGQGPTYTLLIKF